MVAWPNKYSHKTTAYLITLYNPVHKGTQGAFDTNGCKTQGSRQITNKHYFTNIKLFILSGKIKTFSVQNISLFGSSRSFMFLLDLRLIVIGCIHSYVFGFGLQLRWWTPMRSGLNFRPQFSHATRLSSAVWKAASFTAARSYAPLPIHDNQSKFGF